MTKRHERILLACWLAGGLARLLYIVVIHPPVLHIYSDMYHYVEWSKRYFGPQVQNIADTIHPPGTPILYGSLYALDPNWNLFNVVQWILSLGIMGLVWLIAKRLYGPTVGVVAFAMGAFYFPVIHYAALFLAENPFTFFVLLGFWLFLLAIDAPARGVTFGLALAAGLAVGAASSFKNAVLGPFVITGLGYLIYTAKSRPPHRVALTGGAVLGLALLVVPMSIRCTRLAEGNFCLGATNTTMNILMGHYGKTGNFVWRDAPRGMVFNFQSPTTVIRGYTQEAHFDFGAYDSPANLRTALTWIAANPLEALSLSFTNIYDLFAIRTLWPAATLAGQDFGAVFQRIYWLFVLLPGVVYIGWRAKMIAARSSEARADVFLILPLLGIMATVFLSVAEVRYRVPFDPLMIILAAQGYVRVWESLPLLVDWRQRQVLRRDNVEACGGHS